MRIMDKIELKMKNLEELKKKLWKASKPAEEINKDFICIPTLDAIKIIEDSEKS